MRVLESPRYRMAAHKHCCQATVWGIQWFVNVRSKRIGSTFWEYAYMIFRKQNVQLPGLVYMQSTCHVSIYHTRMLQMPIMHLQAKFRKPACYQNETVIWDLEQHQTFWSHRTGNLGNTGKAQCKIYSYPAIKTSLAFIKYTQQSITKIIHIQQ